MPESHSIEKRLQAWDNVPAGSRLTIQVDPGDYVVSATGKLRAPGGGATLLTLGFHELVEHPFVVPIARDADFRLTITLTYVRTEETTGRISASIETPDGFDPLPDFSCEYTGSLGGDSPEDELIIIAVGEP